MLVAQYVLAAQQHLQLGVGHRLAQGAQALPGVFVQESQAAVKGRAAPGFQGPISDFIQFIGDGQHFIGAHAGGRLALVRVAQYGFGNLYLSHCFISLLSNGFIT